MNSRLVGDTMAVTQKIFIVEFGQKSRFLFHHTRVTTILSPLEGRVHHIDYMFIHLSCMHRDEKLVPSLEVYYTGLKKDGK